LAENVGAPGLQPWPINLNHGRVWDIPVDRVSRRSTAEGPSGLLRKTVARIEGVDLPRNKPVWIALTYIYGIGPTSARKIVADAELDPMTRVYQLTDHEVARIRDVILASHRVEGELRKLVSMNIKRLVDLGAYRGLRHRKGLPVRGQRTSTNARTRKGPRRAVARRK
jgi:small subunit ribosomal protein S13